MSPTPSCGIFAKNATRRRPRTRNIARTAQVESYFSKPTPWSFQAFSDHMRSRNPTITDLKKFWIDALKLRARNNLYAKDILTAMRTQPAKKNQLVLDGCYIAAGPSNQASSLVSSQLESDQEMAKTVSVGKEPVSTISPFSVCH